MFMQRVSYVAASAFSIGGFGEFNEGKKNNLF